MLSTRQKMLARRSFFQSSVFILMFGLAFVCGVSFALVYFFDRHDLPASYIAGVATGIVLLIPINSYFIMAFFHKRDAEKIVAAVQAQHDRALASTPDGIFEWDIQNGKRYMSPRLKEMIGFGEGELTSDAESEERVHPDDAEMRKKAIKDHLSGLTPELSVTFRWLHKQGNWMWIKARGKAVFNDDGQPIFLTGTCMDITELKEYEEKLEHARQVAVNESNAKSEFLAHMSHEIRTPLTAISGVAEILYSKKQEYDVRTAKLLGALNASATALRELLGGILDFSKIESGQLRLEKKAFLVAEVFEQIIAIMTPRAAEKEIHFTFDYSASKDFVMTGDPVRFKQILMNLIGNAIKFTEKGEVAIVTRIHLHEGKEYFQIDVRDTGIGIKSDEMEFIFDRFVQADSSVSRKYGGTGLGLPIARQLAVLMGGNIVLKSVFGEGSVFTVCLPVTGNHIPAGVEVGPVMSTSPAWSSLTGSNIAIPGEDKKILIVEDYEGTVTVISQIIESMGLEYDIARTGLQALNKWNANAYGLILMDIQMPEMDGMTALTQIRSIERERQQPRTPVIAMTAHAFLEDQSKCLEAGFDGYLPKPITTDDLISKIGTALRNVAAINNAE